jgi:succinoglycan biosynthesis transport protein ExoP
MDTDLEYTARDYIAAFRRRRRVLAAFSLPVILGAILLSVSLPDTYTSSAQIDINLEGSSANTLEPMQVSAYADQYIAKLDDIAFEQEYLLGVASDPAVIAVARDGSSDAERAAMVRDSIDVSVITQVVLSPITGREVDVISGVRVLAEGPEADYVFKVAETAAALFLEADRLSRTEEASSAFRFLQTQMDITEREILALEKLIADFKVENACCLPELVGLNLSVIERTERDIESIRPRIRALEQDRIFVQRQLQEIRQLTPTTDRLEELEQQYTTLVASYGPNHPDVGRVRREINAIISADSENNSAYEGVELRMQLVEAEQKYSSEHPDVIRLKQQLAAFESTKGQGGPKESSQLLENPRYLQVRDELNAIDSELTALRTSEPELRQRIRDYEERVRKTPQVESEYQALNRRLESQKDNFDVLQKRAAGARQSQALEGTDIAARLELIRAPKFPLSPSGPPRTAIIILGIFLAATLGVGSMLFAEMTDSTIRGSKDIIRVVDIVPLATIPMIDNAASIKERQRRLLLVRGATVVVVVALIIYYVAV